MSPKELFIRNDNNPIIKPDDISYNVNAVFNAGCARYQSINKIIMKRFFFSGLKTKEVYLISLLHEVKMVLTSGK